MLKLCLLTLTLAGSGEPLTIRGDAIVSINAGNLYGDAGAQVRVTGNAFYVREAPAQIIKMIEACERSEPEAR
jgi:hypothetical protein